MSKLIINWDVDSNYTIPYDHSYLVYSSLLQALQEKDGQLDTIIHSEKKSPLYAMSNLIPSGNCKFTSKGMNAHKLVLLISSAHDDILSRFEKAISLAGHIKVGPAVLNYHSSSMTDIVVPSSVPELVSRSPIVLRDSNRYVTSGDSDFIHVLKSKIIAKVSATDNLHNPRISLLRLTWNKKKVFTVHSGKVPCSLVKFVIDADEPVLKNILTYGIGAKTQLGFGMIEVSK